MTAWRTIPGIPTHEVSDDGQIRSKARSVTIRIGVKKHRRILASKPIALTLTERNGKPHYTTVTIRHTTLLVHRLVAMAFLAANCTGGTVFYFNSVSAATCCYNNVAINCYTGTGNPTLATTVFVNTGTLKIYNCFLNGTVYINTGAASDKRNTIEFGAGGDYSVEDCKFADARFLQNIGQLALGMGVENIFDNGGFGDFHIAGDSLLANGGYWEDGITPATDFDGIERSADNISIGPFEAAIQSYFLEKPRLELLRRDDFGNAVSGEFPPVDPAIFETQEE